MALRFAGGRSDIDPQISLDIQSLNAFNNDQLGHFTDLIIAFMLAPQVRMLRCSPSTDLSGFLICTLQSTNLMETVGTFAASHGVNPKALRVWGKMSQQKFFNMFCNVFSLYLSSSLSSVFSSFKHTRAYANARFSFPSFGRLEEFYPGNFAVFQRIPQIQPYATISESRLYNIR
jgi:hypothetical protein